MDAATFFAMHPLPWQKRMTHMETRASSTGSPDRVITRWAIDDARGQPVLHLFRFNEYGEEVADFFLQMANDLSEGANQHDRDVAIP